MQHNMAQPPTAHRAIMNRHHQARRSNSSIAPKLEPGVSFHNNQSPQSRPTPSSHASSPTTSSPGFNNQGVLTPPSSDSQIQHQQQQQQRLHAAKTQAQHALSGTTGLLVNTSVGSPLGAKGQGNGNGTGNTGGPPYYSTFQNHIEQLGKLSRPLLSFSFFGTMFVLDWFREYRTGVRCASRYGWRSTRNHWPRPIPRTDSRWSTRPTSTLARYARRKHTSKLQFDDAAAWSIRPDARHGSIRPFSKHAISHAIYVWYELNAMNHNHLWYPWLGIISFMISTGVLGIHGIRF